MEKKDLKLLKETLQSAIEGDNWLPEKKTKDLQHCLKLVKHELKLQKAREKTEPKRTYDPVEGKTIIEQRDGTTITIYDDDDLQ